jgi:hypothetical protein
VSGRADEPRPYLTVVIPSRNDDHGGGMRERMIACVHGLLDQSRKHRLRAELVLVEWNPPVDRPPLASVFDWSRRQGVDARVVTVPPERHRRWPHSEKVNVHVLAAWNVGIRRARGDFVLCTSADVLLDDELARFLASETLEPDAMYHIDRTDVAPEVARESSTEDRVRACAEKVLAAAEPVRNEFPRGLGIPDLHLSAPGDFALLSRDRWHALGGYPEFDILGVGVDILFCYLAQHAGAREVVLRPPMHLYHIDHSRQWGRPRHGLERVFYERLGLRSLLPRSVRRALGPAFRRLLPRRKTRWEALGVPALSYADVEDYVVDLYRGRNRIPANGPEWGLGAETLPEAWLSRASGRNSSGS